MRSSFFNSSFGDDFHIRAATTRNKVVCTVAVVNLLVVFVLLAALSNLKRTIKIILLNLLVSDIYLMSTGLLYGLFVQTKVDSSHPRCLVSVFFTLNGFFVSHAAVAIISLNNFLAVFYPLKQHLWVTTKSVSMTVIVTWFALFALSACCIVVNFPSNEPCVVVANIPRFGIIITFCVLLIFDISVIVMNSSLCVVLRRRRKVHVHQVISTSKTQTSNQNNKNLLSVCSAKQKEDANPIIQGAESSSTSHSSPPKSKGKKSPNLLQIPTTKVKPWQKSHLSSGHTKNPEIQHADTENSAFTTTFTCPGKPNFTENPADHTASSETSAHFKNSTRIINSAYVDSLAGTQNLDNVQNSGESCSGGVEPQNQRDRQNGLPMLKIPKPLREQHTESLTLCSSQLTIHSVSFRDRRNRFHNLSISMVIIAMWCCIFNIPCLIYLFYIAFIAEDRYSANYSTLGILFTTFMTTNVLGDPFIYAWRFVQWRNVMAKMRSLKNRCCHPNNS